jgi:hypothetical protein
MNFENKYISSYQSICHFLQNKKLAIDFNGKISQILSPLDYKIRLMKLIGLIMIGFIVYIIKQIPYFPITITGNTIYSRVVASCLSRYKIPYVLCKGTNRIPFYETQDGQEIPFEGPSPNFFSNSKEQLIPLIPNTKEELSQLEFHTKLRNLENIQSKILSGIPSKDNVYIISVKDIIHDGIGIKNPIINIRRFFGNLYYIMTINEIWISRLIITDNVMPLQPGEVISSLCGTIISEHNEKYNIEKKNNSYIIQEPTQKTIITRCFNYKVNIDLTIDTIKNSEGHIQSDESILYSLKSPRPFINNNSLYIMHPFHFPETWDPFLTIMIITLALLQ